MADTKISALTDGSSAQATDQIPINRGGANFRLNASTLAGFGAGVTKVSLTPGSGGNFTVAHGLGSTPSFVVIVMTSGGQIWLQNPTSFDGTNLYCVASDAGVTGTALIWR